MGRLHGRKNGFGGWTGDSQILAANHDAYFWIGFEILRQRRTGYVNLAHPSGFVFYSAMIDSRNISLVHTFEMGGPTSHTSRKLLTVRGRSVSNPYAINP